ncbi:mRNA-decapping enzyme subunit 2 [Tulasnella sp. 424]|nr:mRNA-decapping enzyme subunit 2 [Tulasnella sp. 424]
MSNDSPVTSSLAPTAKPTRKKPPAPELPPPAFSFKDANMDIILEDLSSRFILNLPDNELSSVERVCFQVEQAHWYYEDFIRQENPTLPSMQLRSFSAKLFAACPLLQRWSHRHEEAFNDFVKYKTSVPVCGAILLNSTWDKCILVKGWKSNAPWGFPRGKINENEPLEKCAAREVLEETGYNCEDQIIPDAFITTTSKEQHVTLFVIPDVPEDYNFVTRTRKEISKIEWFYLAHLSGFSEDDDARNHRGFSQALEPIRTWGVSPFLAQLKHRLIEFQVTFGYMPPDLNPRQLKEYRRVQRNKARAAGRRKAEAARAEAAAIEAAVADGESTGAEGDEEPETETDHDLHLSQSSGQLSVPSSATPAHAPAQANSAIDALFTRTVIGGGAGNSSPDTSSLSPAKKGSKAPKPAKTSRNKQAPTDAAVMLPGQDDEVARERAHFASLMQSLALSQPPGVPSSNQAVSSGLPTPADSPVVNSGAATARNAAASLAQPGVPSPDHAGQSKAASSSQKSLFDFVSPMDALMEPSPSKKKIVSTRPPATATPSWSSSASRPSSGVTSGSEPFRSGGSSEELGATSEDEGLDDSDTVAPEAPATLMMPTRMTGGMMHRALHSAVEPSKSSSVLSPRAATPDAALHLTPKARQPAVMDDLSAPPSTTTSRMTSSSSIQSLHSMASHSTGSSSTTAQHLALLDMVATEADAIATCPNAQTPHAAPVGLPPATSSNIGLRMVPQNGAIGVAHNHHPTIAAGQPYANNTVHRGLPTGNAMATEPYGQFNVQGLPSQPQPPRSHVYMAPPQLHHPHPHLHPQQLISIPSASPSPNLSTSASGMPHPAQMAAFGLQNNGNFANAPYSPQMNAQLQAQHNMLLQRQRQATATPPSQGFYQSPRSPLAPLGHGRPQTVGVHPAPLSGNLGQTGRQSSAHGPALSTSPRSPLAGQSPYTNRLQMSPPNPNSFAVQKTQAERNQLLDLFRARSPPKNLVNIPNTTAPSLAPVPGLVSVNPVPAPNLGTSSMANSIFEGGFIPANVQFRAMTNRASRPGTFPTSPSK